MWDYKIASVPAYTYSDQNFTGRLVLEILCVIMLVLNCLSEISGVFAQAKCSQKDNMGGSWCHADFKKYIHLNIIWVADFIRATKRFELLQYFQFWNLIDLTHFVIMWAGWALWLRQVNLASNLDMPSSFAILSSFGDETPARLFQTNSDKEYVFLKFVQYIKNMRDNLSIYSTLSSMSGAYKYQTEHFLFTFLSTK